MNTLVILVLVLAAVPTALFAVNLFCYRRAPRRRREDARPALVSILIPARNEAAVIARSIQAALQTRGVDFEVVVLDDHSTDSTRSIVESIAAARPEVRLIQGTELPEGWCGKQHACWQLAKAARGDLLLFVDADVTLAPDAAERLVAYLDRRPDVHLASGIPRQLTVTLGERLLIPLIHTVLLGYLPIIAARLSRWTAFAAGCGQLFIARRAAYFATGGHQSIRRSLHDGVTLPRAFRSAGFATDILDATDLATCRMYQSSAEVWRGLSKNATEGLAHPIAILPWTVLLLGGHVMPLLWMAFSGTSPLTSMGLLALGPWLSRFIAAARYRQDLLGALLHPIGVATLVLLQWCALKRSWSGKPSEWRGRRYPGSLAVDTRHTAHP